MPAMPKEVAERLLAELSKETMPWGKYVGKTFDTIPMSYFDFILNQGFLKPHLHEKIEAYRSLPIVAMCRVKEELEL